MTPQTIQVGGLKLYGVSVGAVETCICVPSLSLAFDAGRCPPGAIAMQFMAITHGHCDHVHGLPLHVATRNLQKMTQPTYFVPPAIQEDVENLVDAVARLERSSFESKIIALGGGESVPLKAGWLLRAFRTSHTVPSQGYIVYNTRKKLKQEYVGMKGKEIGAMREQGIDVSRQIDVPELAFTGDTTLQAICDSEDCRKARILITEMTFLDNECTAADARQFGHIHLDEVIERKEVFEENDHVVFTHFSARYSNAEIMAAMEKLPRELREKAVAFGVEETEFIDVGVLER